MIKSELVQRIAAQNPHLYQRDIENIVNAILGEVTNAMARGDRVELRGFGAFSVKHRPARTGRNPRTGAHVSVEQKSVPFFKTGKEMRERLNKNGAGLGLFPGLTRVLLSWPGFIPAIDVLWRGVTGVPQDCHRHHRRPAGDRDRRFCVGQPADGDGIVRSIVVGGARLCGDAAAVRCDPLRVLILGVLIGGFAAWMRQGKWRRDARRFEGEMRALHAEMDTHPPPLRHVRKAAGPGQAGSAGDPAAYCREPSPAVPLCGLRDKALEGAHYALIGQNMRFENPGSA